MAAHQAPPTLGFSRQEHWSGLPFPSPMCESESEVAQSCPTLSDPMDCGPPGSSVYGICQARVENLAELSKQQDQKLLIFMSLSFACNILKQYVPMAQLLTLTLPHTWDDSTTFPFLLKSNGNVSDQQRVKSKIILTPFQFILKPVQSWSEVAQSCPTLCDPMDCSPPGSSVRGIFQARTLEWVAISFARRSSQPRDWTQVSRIAGRRFTFWATREDKLSNSNINFNQY